MFKRLFNGTKSLESGSLTNEHFKPSTYRSKYIEITRSDCDVSDAGVLTLPKITTNQRITSVNDRTFMLVFHPSLKVGMHIAECARGDEIFNEIKTVRIPKDTGLPEYIVRIYEFNSDFSTKGD